MKHDLVLLSIGCKKDIFAVLVQRLERSRVHTTKSMYKLKFINKISVFFCNIIGYTFSKNAIPTPNADIAIPRKIIALAQKSKAPKQFSSLSKYEKYGNAFK